MKIAYAEQRQSIHLLHVIELDTILAALRYWQRVGTQDSGAPEHTIAEGDHGCFMDVADIDDLCERINCV